MDALFYFVIAIIWGLASWWQKRKEESEAKNWSDSQWLDQSTTQTPSRNSAPPSQPQASPAPAPKPSSGGGWEEELRRLLEGDQGAPKPAAPSPAPRPAAPVPRAVSVPEGQRPTPAPPQSAPRPAPAPPPVVQSQPARNARTTGGYSAPKLVSDINGDYFHTGLCAHCGGRLLFPDGAVGRSLNCPHCNEDTPLRPMASPQDHPGPVYAQGGGPHGSMASQISELFSVHESAQRAVVASIVFGKPKSLEREGETNLF